MACEITSLVPITSMIYFFSKKKCRQTDFYRAGFTLDQVVTAPPSLVQMQQKHRPARFMFQLHNAIVVPSLVQTNWSAQLTWQCTDPLFINDCGTTKA